MKILTGIFMVLMDIFMIIVALCAIVVALIVLDFVLDTNIKERLNSFLGKRESIKKLKENVSAFIDIQDEASKEKAKRRDNPVRDDAWYDLFTIDDRRDKKNG